MLKNKKGSPNDGLPLVVSSLIKFDKVLRIIPMHYQTHLHPLKSYEQKS